MKNEECGGVEGSDLEWALFSVCLSEKCSVHHRAGSYIHIALPLISFYQPAGVSTVTVFYMPPDGHTPPGTAHDAVCIKGHLRPSIITHTQGLTLTHVY